MATKDEMDKATNACKWITNLEAPIDNVVNKGPTAIKELAKGKETRFKDIKADLESLAKYIQSFIDKGKEAKKSAKAIVTDVKSLADNKINYEKFKTQATINLRAPYGSAHVWAEKIETMYDKLKKADKDSFVKEFTGKMVTTVYNAVALYETSYKSFLADLAKL